MRRFLMLLAAGGLALLLADGAGREARAAGAADGVADLQVRHHAGLTFITWKEVDPPVVKEQVTWGELRKLLATPAKVSYAIYRSDAPITAANLAGAERIADVPPLSVYNVRGRSVDELMAAVRRRAIDDLDLAKKLSQQDYFSHYSPQCPEMDEVIVGRFAIEDGKALSPGTGLFVHQPGKPGRAHYAVVAVPTAVDEKLAPQVASSGPVDEAVGPGEPVLQGTPDVAVFFDYPGKRYRYVQWGSPSAGTSNLPGTYYNWGVFVPRDFGSEGTTRRLGVFFHDDRQRYLKPPWPHRQDTVLISPHDAPFAGFGYGHNDALGTDKPADKGVVREYLGRRVDAFVSWAVGRWQVDAGSISVGGRGYWGGTAAVQYGLRRPGRIAWVAAEGDFDPDPQQTPHEIRYYNWRPSERPRPTRRGEIDAVWGTREMNLQAETGRSIWQEANLPARVRAGREALPYLTLGAGGMHVTWKQETELMKACHASGNAFMAEFFWGGSAALQLPKEGFAPRSDGPLLAAWPQKYSPNPDYVEKHFLTGERGYGGGGRLNTPVRWLCESARATADRFEMTVYADRDITYAGEPTVEATLRRTGTFAPAAGTPLRWSLVDAKKNKLAGGEMAAGEGGRIVIPELTIPREPATLVVEVRKEAP